MSVHFKSCAAEKYALQVGNAVKICHMLEKIFVLKTERMQTYELNFDVSLKSCKDIKINCRRQPPIIDILERGD